MNEIKNFEHKSNGTKTFFLYLKKYFLNISQEIQLIMN